MPLVKVLPPDVAAKIAAGEVVERPASVVKELLDNAVDAAASRVTVEIEDGGQKLIRVTDDGCGMTREDVRLAVERHATSKISAAEDLDAIATLGFRGEALASIAAVTRFEILTRREEDLEGTRLTMHGTVEPEIEPVGCPAGTSITAADIYFNTPARRKFLKTTATELSHVADMVNKAALPNHEIHFTLRHNGKPVLDYPRVTSREERLFAFWKGDIWNNMRALPDLGADGKDAIRIEGYVSAPTESRNRADQIFFFVNDRYVQNRSMLSAVMEAYRRLLHPGRYPILVAFLYLDPSNYDINVHPKKQEIKFSDEQKIWRAVYGSVREAISRLERETSRVETLPQATPVQPSPQPTPESGQQKSETPTQSSEETKPVADGLTASSAERIRMAVDRFFEKRQAESGSPAMPQDQTQESPETIQAQPAQQPETAKVQPKISAELFDDSAKPHPRSQILNTYIVCEQAGQMILIDQHAAAERIRYEQLKSQLRQGKPQQQTLMFPEMVEVPPGEVALMEESLPLLEQFGFDIQYLGQNSFSVSAMPAICSMQSCEQVVMDLLKDLGSSGGANTLEERQERMLISMACHGSIRGGESLSKEAMHDLVEQLFKSEHPYTCPHGRPTLIAFGPTELERMFKRSGF